MPTHKKPESERFKGPAKWCQYVVARTVVSLLQRLPIRFAFRLGRGIGWLCWKLLTRRRAVVRKNLEIVNAWMDAQRADGGSMMNDGGSMMNDGGSMMNDGGESSEPESVRRKKNAHPSLSATEDTNPSSFISYHSSLALPLEAQVKEVFQRSGANLVAGFPLSRLSPERMEHYLEIEGLEYLRAALAQGKGVIMLLAHMGPWEVLTQLPQLAAARGVTASLGAMYRPLNNAYLDEWIRKQREGVGTRLFSRRDGFHKPVDFLRAGGVLGILSDQKMREGPAVPYFGKEVHSSPIPGLFHRRSGAPLLALSLTTEAATRWSLRITAVEIPPETDLNDRASMATLCNRALENTLSQSPLDGFWLHKRF